MEKNYSEDSNFSSEPGSVLMPLNDLEDFKVAKDNLDVRGWEVLGADGRRLGVVSDLIVDEALMKVRYLDVELDSDLVTNNDDHHILVPIGSARLQEDGDKVYVNHLDQITLPRFPLYPGGGVVPEYERLIRDAMINPTKAPEPVTEESKLPIPADFYKHEYFDERKFYDKSANSNPVHHDIQTIERLVEMRDKGILTDEEFQHLKRRAIGL